MAKLIGAASLLVGVVAWAAPNPLVISASVFDGTLSISTTQPMPKAWFSSSNVIDRTKSDLRVTYTIAGTACTPAATGTLSSNTIGEFTPVLNTDGNNAIGHHWNTTVDVAAFAEHYTIHTQCEGSEHIHGCNVARPVSVTVQAVDKNGASLTYLDDLGVTQLVKVTLDAGSIAPVRDATIAETNCATSCGIGQCVSACEHSCSTGKCKDLCQCQCKILKHNENPECYQNALTECAP